MTNALQKRSSGILLHITSLPSKYGIGDLGKEAYEFVDFLHSARQSYWQILPLNPTNPESGNSPYSSSSAFACNKLMINPELLFESGLLKKEDVAGISKFENSFVNFKKVGSFKDRILQKSFDIFKTKRRTSACKKEFHEFCILNNQNWLNDYAIFETFKNYFRPSTVSWNFWPDEIKNRDKYSCNKLQKCLADEIEKEKFFQYIFFKQWFSLKKYANSQNVKIIGDIPIYVDYNSADVWVNGKFFKLNKDKKPSFIAGVPPDCFSNLGQLWKNPVYNWKELKKDGYSWWIKRLEHNFKLFDITRIDHFRGFISYWEVDAAESDAVNGKWVKAFPDDFFSRLFKYFKELPIIAEDLGGDTDEVKKIMKKFNIPGTKVLLNAFNETFPKNPYVPFNYVKNCVAYTGTHDYNPIRGWFKKEATIIEKNNVSKYLGKKIDTKNIHIDFIRLVLSSVADLAIIPIQDILGLDHSSRMNFPSVLYGNWKWRLLPGQLNDSVKNFISDITKIYDRI